MTKISLTLLSILFAFSLWIFLKYSPKDENKKKAISIYNAIIFSLGILFCAFYAFKIPEILQGLDDVGPWTGVIVFILGFLVIFSACLLLGFFIRLLIFIRAYKNFKAFILSLPVIISFILLAAHCLRDINIVLAIYVLIIMFLILYFLEPMSAKVAQIVLVLGSIEWIRSGYIHASTRMQNHVPYMRLVFIMGGVACFTLLSALVFFTKPIKERYKIVNG